ncbi:GntR family transcriptional regulator [Streptomyces atratus]|uniref:GntR family transcriptional regulator n=1 Tax=Streptomyces atratus TaxID=1893 RepID=UPI0016713784|nr:GntR family transcriptional regulator [Streptomyces atratus]WPW26318.1 GntR family transcriptional regulator [Streptomyces atratus]GGT65924.1 GntR family transcriptional regulator [Streptomyces atratus]
MSPQRSLKPTPRTRRATPADDGPSASERAYAHIRARLFDGTFTGNMMLSEGDIAEELAISRTPVHEALLRCEFEGHIRLYPKRGALVLPVSAKEIQDVLVTRRLIEVHAADLAAQSRELGPGLLAQVDTQADLLHRELDEEFSTADDAFHKQIIQATGNGLLDRAYAMARDVPLRVGNSNLRRHPERVAQLIAEHRAIAQAIADGDPAAARAAVEHHLDMAMKSLLRAI